MAALQPRTRPTMLPSCVAARPRAPRPCAPHRGRAAGHAPCATAPSSSSAPPEPSSSSSKYWAERVPSTRQAQALRDTAVVLAADGPGATPRPATDWVACPGTRSILVVARSLGCPFCQALARGLAAEALADLDAAGVILYLVSIGVPARAADFCDLTGFPRGRLLADADATVYAALELERGAAAAFLSPATPLAIGREVTGGGGATLAAAFKGWAPYLPPKPYQHALHQGGTFGFAGDVCVAARADRATADHLPPSKIRELGLGLPRAVE